MSDKAVRDYVQGIDHDKRRKDALVLVDLISRVTGEEPRLWGSIVGFGQYHYEYRSGRQGDGPAAAFAPRKAASTIYVADGVGTHADLLEKLGPHTSAVGCIYIKDVDAVDLDVLGQIVAQSYANLTSATFTDRAREGGA